MSDVDLSDARQARTPHITGTCRCNRCSHEWEGVAPVGTLELECPDCGAMTGFFKQHIMTDVGSTRFVCNTCDGELFSVMADGSALCAGCGTTHWPYADEAPKGA